MRYVCERYDECQRVRVSQSFQLFVRKLKGNMGILLYVDTMQVTAHAYVCVAGGGVCVILMTQPSCVFFACDVPCVLFCVCLRQCKGMSVDANDME